MFTKDTLLELMEDITKTIEIQLQNIPEIDLYMDQVTTFMDKKLDSFKRDPEDKILTKTMINNYSKAGILIPLKKKKYSRQHMILLITIYKLKQILSINDIEILFSPLLDKAREANDKKLIEEVYAVYLEVEQNKSCGFEIISDSQLELIEKHTAQFNNEEAELLKWFLMVMLLVNEANDRKRLAEKIIDKYFK
jgi:hypothetical protein